MPTAALEHAKPYHHGSLREACLEVGGGLLAEVGVAKFSLREVARRLDVTPTALYHHFPEKEDLLFALAHEGLRQFQETLSRAASVAEDSLTAMGVAYIQFFRERPYYMDLLFRPETKFDDRVRDIWCGTFELIDSALQRRGIDKADSPYLSIWLWSGVHGLAGMLRDRILGSPEQCAPGSPEPFHLTGDELLQKIIPLVGRLIGPDPRTPR